jgi:hypothetical protein
MSGGFCRIGLDKNMNVIWHNLHRVNRSIQLRGFLVKQNLQSFRNKSSQNRLSIFGAPYNVIFQGEHCPSIFSISFRNHDCSIHNYYKDDNKII